MITHTPGTWKTDEDEHDAPYQDIKIKAVGRTICTIWIDDAPVHDYNAKQQANARLIAAAPDLLEALREICEWTERYTAPGHPIATVAKRAIAKATGETP